MQGSPHEPTPAECSAGAAVEHDGRRGFATWYPQMGGYVGRCVVLFGAKGERCFDVFVWHDGEFPFGSEGDGFGPRGPVVLHHCNAEQFIEFGRLVQAKQSEPR